MYLTADEVAKRYNTHIGTIWRWAKAAANPFPAPVYFGVGRRHPGFGDSVRGATARWRAYDLMMYDLTQQIDQDEVDQEFADAKRGALLAMLRRAYPELDRAPEGFELQARQAHEAAQAKYRPAFLRNQRKAAA